VSTWKQLQEIGLNSFAVQLLAESMLKSLYVTQCGTKPLTFEFPIRRRDCADWAGVRINIEAVPAVAAASVPARTVLPAVDVVAPPVPLLAALVEALEMLERDARMAFDVFGSMTAEQLATSWEAEEPAVYDRYAALLAIAKAATFSPAPPVRAAGAEA